MQKIAVLLALALGILFPVLSQAYVVAPKVGVVMVEIKSGDTFSGICADLSKNGLLPEKFGAIKCKNAALARNGLTEESARYIQPGDLYFFPYIPIAKVTVAHEKTLGNVKTRLTAIIRERNGDIAVLEARLREWQFGTFLGVGMMAIFAVLTFFITRWYYRTEIIGLEGKVSFFEAELGRWKPGGTAMYEALCPDGTYLRVPFVRIGSGLKECNGELVPFVKLKSSAKISDPVIHEENVEAHILKYFVPRPKSELKQPETGQTWSLQ